MNNEDNIEIRGTLISRISNELVFEVFESKEKVKVLLNNKKGFDNNYQMVVGELYKLICGKDKEGNLWLNQRILLEIVKVTEVKSDCDFEFSVPKHGEDYKQFHTDKRTALMNAIEFHSGKNKTYTEDMVITTAKRFLFELTNNLGGKN